MKGLFGRWSERIRGTRDAPADAPPAADDPTQGSAIQSAIALHQAGRLDEAEVLYNKVLAADPNNFDALHLSGVIAQQRGDGARAIELMRHALAVDPANSQALCNLGVALQSQQRFGDAEDALRKSLALQPESDRALNNLGITLQLRGREAEAETCFRRAIAVNPRNAEALANLGSLRKDSGDLAQAVMLYRSALELNPNVAEVCNNLGSTLQHQGDFAGAETLYRRALALRPDYAGAHGNLGSVFLMQRRLDDAAACFRTALQLNPNDASAKYNQAMVALLRGDYQQGLALYESRFDALARDFAQTIAAASALRPDARWRGEPLAGRRLLVWTEQGLGDSLMVMRYLPLLKARGAGTVTLIADPALARVMQTLHGVDRVATRFDAVSADSYDAHCPIMSLPHLFGTRFDSIPHAVPYLSVPEQLRAEWSVRVRPIAKLKVGLAWAGNRALRDDARRSIALDEFAPLRAIEGIQLVSLQKGDAAQQLEAWDGDVHDWMRECHDFLDTAALVDNLDLVICVDTAVAHLAGALGKPVWLLNRAESEWRWGLEREDTPWYPTMRIFRQQRGFEWGSVVARVAAELEARTGAGR